ncbi:MULTISPECIES: flavin reductase family protein [unclassified Methanoculleus]|jgi:flavin reductase (DIM6/NTAB) family NADH-FMN oxidoreductase RutF|uniref:Flavin reductase family protein n=1 Tax=Methanoculleus palmolei TaxID=72612 RepID=A0ABD8A8M3_9EURY|nr:flavin reductase family protein [Methanoculleus sp. UBA377]MDD2472934.1 flavin reductase family protein [Methanoculleus sp.]WOX55393.1 flavin reductase family protein [Methanoculleus palmolei]
MNEIPLDRVYRFIEPGPVVLVTTVDNGHNNIMTMSYHMVIDDSRPLIGCIIGPWDHSFTALCATGECVIAVPAVDLASRVVAIGNCSGRDIDKFNAFGLTPMPARQVKPPLVAECPVNLECQVADAGLVDRYNLFILEVVKAWVDPERAERRVIHHNGDGTFVVDGETIDFQEQMVKWPTYLC